MSGHFRELEVWQASMRLAGVTHALADAQADTVDNPADAGLAAELKQAAAAIPEEYLKATVMAGDEGFVRDRVQAVGAEVRGAGWLLDVLDRAA